MTHETPQTPPTDAQVRERVMFADAALRLAGHDVTDPELRELGDARIRGEISGDDFRAEARRRIQNS